MNAKENGEKPACGFAHDLCGVSGGLTKRETIAMNVIAAIVTRAALNKCGDYVADDCLLQHARAAERAANTACVFADALLAELAKEKP